MKNFICLPLTALVLSFVSCEKNTEVATSTTDLSPAIRTELQQEAQKFAKKHDQLVYEMLSLDNELLMKRSPAVSEMSERERLDHVLTVIYRVTGVKPVIVEQQSAKVSAAVSSDDPDYYWVNLDADEISLAPYAATEKGLQYLSVVDDIVQNQESSVDEKVLLLDEVLKEVALDEILPKSEMERVLTSVEVLRGSLILWNDYLTQETPAYYAPGIQKASIRNWSFGKKLAFVAAADAVGGVLGFFLGGYITVGGVPIYMPAGPTGMVLSAAALSYIAASMVGW